MGSHILNLLIVQLNSHSTEEGFQHFKFFCVVLPSLCLSPFPYPSSSLLFLISLPSPFFSPSTPFFSVQSVMSGIYSHTQRVASLNTAREELIHASSTENATEVQEDLKDLMTTAFCFELLKIEL